MATSPTKIGTPRYDAAGRPTPRVPIASNASSRFRSSGRRDRRTWLASPSPMAMSPSSRRSPSARKYGNSIRWVAPIDERDIDLVGRERLLELVAESLDENGQVELLGDRRTDVVDERQLAVALAGLTDEARVVEGHTEARGEGRQKPDVRIAEGMLAIEVLERDDAGHLTAATERDEQRRLRGSPWMTSGCPIACARSWSTRLSRNGSRVSMTCLR